MNKTTNALLFVGTVCGFFLPPLVVGAIAYFQLWVYQFGVQGFLAATLEMPYSWPSDRWSIPSSLTFLCFFVSFVTAIAFWRTRWGKTAAMLIVVAHCCIVATGLCMVAMGAATQQI